MQAYTSIITIIYRHQITLWTWYLGVFSLAYFFPNCECSLHSTAPKSTWLFLQWFIFTRVRFHQKWTIAGISGMSYFPALINSKIFLVGYVEFSTLRTLSHRLNIISLSLFFTFRGVDSHLLTPLFKYWEKSPTKIMFHKSC